MVYAFDVVFSPFSCVTCCSTCMLLRKWELPMAGESGEVEQMLENATVVWLHSCDCAEPCFLLLILITVTHQG